MESLIKLKFTVFTSGFVLMVFELVGLRVLAPFLGSSTIIWTSVIGIILLFMSLGYSKGGQLADKYPKKQNLGIILMCASISIFLMNLIKNSLLGFLNSFEISLISKSIISCTFLFGATSFLLALVSPFVIRLSIDKKDNSGRIVGALYAYSALGSILGTFIGGFFLISWMGTNLIIYCLGIILAINSILFISKKFISINLFVSIVFLTNTALLFRTHPYIDIDSNYSRILIQNTQHNNREATFLLLDGYVNSGMYNDSPDELNFEYTQFYDVFDFYNPAAKKVLLLGGGAFSYPKHFQKTYPEKSLDIVEIDPELLEIAQNHFSFNQNERTKVHLEDARTFLHHNQEKFDVVLYDVFTSPISVPFHLTTLEAFTQVSTSMESNGILILNILADLEGKSRDFLESEYLTLKNVFPTVQLFSAQEKNLNGLNNYMLVAFKGKNVRDLKSAPEPYESLLANPIPFSSRRNQQILTDNFAPTDRLLGSY